MSQSTKRGNQAPLGGDDRIAIVEAARTPFAKAWTVYEDWNEADLGRVAVREVVERAGIDPALIDDVVLGCVSAPMNGPNVAREVVLRTPIPETVPASTTQMYCASSALATVQAAGSILMGGADIVIAGGVESMSSSQARVSRRLSQALNRASGAGTPAELWEAFRGLEPEDLTPEAPGIDEPTTGDRMGDSAETMAKRYGISRQDQDAYAEQTHHRAAAAYEEGHFPEVVPVLTGEDFDEPIERDTNVRADTSVEQMSKLGPAFDKRHGTVTAGNASPLTDGASAVMVMRESTADRLGLEPMAYLRAWSSVGVDIFDIPLLMGPTLATPKALTHADLTLEEMDLIEMHEAFAAQILANLKVWASDELCREVGLDGAIGEVDMDIFNVNGGSIPIGHPFGATGTRMVGQLAGELQRRDGRYGLMTLCAGGGLGMTLILER